MVCSGRCGDPPRPGRRRPRGGGGPRAVRCRVRGPFTGPDTDNVCDPVAEGVPRRRVRAPRHETRPADEEPPRRVVATGTGRLPPPTQPRKPTRRDRRDHRRRPCHTRHRPVLEERVRRVRPRHLRPGLPRERDGPARRCVGGAEANVGRAERRDRRAHANHARRDRGRHAGHAARGRLLQLVGHLRPRHRVRSVHPRVAAVARVRAVRPRGDRPVVDQGGTQGRRHHGGTVQLTRRDHPVRRRSVHGLEPVGRELRGPWPRRVLPGDRRRVRGAAGVRGRRGR